MDKKIIFISQSAKAGHLQTELTIAEALVQAREEIARGRWVYAKTGGEMQRLEENNINEGFFQQIEELMATPNLEGGINVSA